LTKVPSLPYMAIQPCSGAQTRQKEHPVAHILKQAGIETEDFLRLLR